MKYNYVFECADCGRQEEGPADFADEYQCFCGGTMYHCGECYDQDWVDQQRYEEQQDREYEERHRYND